MAPTLKKLSDAILSFLFVVVVFAQNSLILVNISANTIHISVPHDCSHEIATLTFMKDISIIWRIYTSTKI